LFAGRSLLSRDWQISSLLFLVGFAAYQLLVAQVINTSSFSTGRVKALFDDLLKVATALVVMRLVSGHAVSVSLSFDPLSDQEWLKECGLFLVGFAAYDLATFYIYDTTTIVDSRARSSVNDAIKFGTAWIVFQWLAGKSFNKTFALETLGFVGGLVAYEYLFMNKPYSY